MCEKNAWDVGLAFLFFFQKNSVSVLLEDVDSLPAFIEENIASIAAIGEVLFCDAR